MASETWTVRRLLEWTEEFLRKKGFESPRLEAQILLAHVLQCSKIDLYVRHEEQPGEDKRTAFREMIKKRSEGTPVAHLVGHREFYSLSFAVTPDVLIPRPDSETLVLEALRLLKPQAAPRVLDLGTGSGCIAVTIAKQHKTSHVTAVDRSPPALAIAEQNARQHGVAERMAFHEGDLFAAVESQVFDVIVSNPPYIAEAEFASLEPGVRDFEPRMALSGGADGLDFYRRIATEAGRYLKADGTVLVEIGASQEDAVREVFARNWQVGRTLRDLGGRPRVISAKKIA